ncbi:MAG TPA: hypothetical protein VKE40_03165, partial [Gemmataceae bacterium]|nr:hypothetical protein [Gemmataceae bacterium]
LDYTAYNTPVRVFLGLGAATGTSGISNIANVVGGSASDIIVGDAQDNELTGNGGRDILIGAAGSDVIDGGAGDDSLVAGTGNDVILGGIGNDFLFGMDADTTWRITAHNAGRVGAAAFNTIESLVGGTGDDEFIFSAGQSMSGTIDGGDGVNTLNYTAYTTPVRVYLGLGAATGTSGISNITNVIGGAASDILVGDAQDNELTGNGGRDILIGAAGTDVIDGGAGDDLVFGGSTAFDLDATALESLRSEWTRFLSYNNRINHLTGATPGGLNGTNFLTVATVTNDGKPDSVTGGIGQDWFLAFSDDELIDPTPTETVTLF